MENIEIRLRCLELAVEAKINDLNEYRITQIARVFERFILEYKQENENED